MKFPAFPMQMSLRNDYFWEFHLFPEFLDFSKSKKLTPRTWTGVPVRRSVRRMMPDERAWGPAINLVSSSD